MDENPEDVATDTSVDVEEATDSNETSEQEDADALQEKLDLAEKAKSQILARAKKAEEELKKLKESQANPPINNQDPYFQDELRLIAQGIDGQAILKAKIIAKGSGVSLLDAMKDEAVIAYIKDIKELQRREKAKLGASKGSGESQDDTLIKQNMTREEHQEAFKKVMDNVRT